jgi:hypothetical protein
MAVRQSVGVSVSRELERAEERSRQALAVVDDLALVERWGRVGRVVLVGAVSYDLVVSPDVDFEVFTDGVPKVSDGFAVAAHLAEHRRIRKVRFTNALASVDQGLYWQFLYRSDDATEWKVDVWMLASDHPGPLSTWMIEPMRQALTPESRRRILRLKEARTRGEVDGVASIDIYRAVLEDGVDSVDELRAYLGSDYVPMLTPWLPNAIE